MRKSIEDGCIRHRQAKWRKKEQATFILRLGELLDAGYPLVDALRFLQSQETSKRKPYIDDALIQLKAGQSLFEVLNSLGFHPQLLQFVYYAEHYGNLPHALTEGGQFWHKRNEDQDKMIKIFIYPITLLCMMMVISSLFQGFLLPKFLSLYESMNIPPSVFLHSIVMFSQVSTYFPYALMVFFVIFWIVKKYWYERKAYLERRRYILRIPFVNQYMRLFDTYYMSYQLSSLLAGGLSINDCMKLFSKHNHQPFFRELGACIYSELHEGRSLEQVFDGLPFFEHYMSAVIANGQKNGKLDQELYYYSRIILQTLESKITAFLKVVQPLLFVVVGVVVVSIYLSILLPMFSIMDGL